MNELILEPYAARVRWHLPQAISPDGWQRLVSAYLDEVGRDSQTAGPCIIGHIKGFALLPGGGFLRVSKVSTSYPAQVEVTGHTEGMTDEVELAINVLVYGLPLEQSSRLVLETGRKLAAAWNGEFFVLSEALHSHGHHETSLHE